MIRGLVYSQGKVTEANEVARWKEALAQAGTHLWVDIEEPRSKSLKHLKECFGFDDISLSDTLSFSLLPKLDTFPNYAFVVIHALGYDEASGEITRRELDLFLGKNFLVTIHQDRIPAIDKVFEEARHTDAVLSRGSPLTAHIIIDRLVDLTYQMVSVFDDDIEEIENRVAAGQLTGIVPKTLRLRRALLLMKKSVGPQRDVLNELARRDAVFIGREAALHFRDDYDRLARVYDQIDTNRELVAAAAEAYRSMVSLKINEASLRTNAVIERLTLVATVFLPVTAVASWYGMNFENMPELSLSWFYPLLFLAMFALGLWMWRSFREEIEDVREAERLRFLPEIAGATGRAQAAVKADGQHDAKSAPK